MSKTITDTEALISIQNAMKQLCEQMNDSQKSFDILFDQYDEMINTKIRKIEQEIDELKKTHGNEGRTDTFVCEKCGSQIKLKVMGDSTHCRERGCDGIAYRFYQNHNTQESKRSIRYLFDQIDTLRKQQNKLEENGIALHSLLSTTSSSFNYEHINGVLNYWINLLNMYNQTQLESNNISSNETSNEQNDEFKPNRKTPRDLPVTQYGYQTDIDGNQVYDSPIETTKYLCPRQGNARAGYEGTCGLCSCANVIRLAGVNVDEGQIIDYASVNNLCDFDGATSPLDRKEILNHFGVDSGIFPLNKDFNGKVTEDNMDQIETYVSSGKGVILSVHALTLWRGLDHPTNDFHAITVISTKKDAQGNLLGFYVNDTGSLTGGTAYYSKEILLKSLTGKPMNVTHQVIR